MTSPAASVKRDPHQSTVHLRPGPWPTVWAALVAQFPHVGATAWLDRIQRGRVLDADGLPVTPRTPCSPGMCIRYFREVPDEQPIPGVATVLYHDGHLLVADKPPFLPVVPSGGYLEQTLLHRLLRQTANPDLVPLHRIDRLTAGLVLFSVNPRTRAAYQAMFRERRVAKRYEALAPAVPALAFPRVHRSRLVRGEPFFRMTEAGGAPNSETRIEVLDQRPGDWRYALYPVTGRKHQLRVHMAALGAPIRNDPWYPGLGRRGADDHAHPLRLLAQGLAFVDPLSGEPRRYESRRTL